MSRYNNASFDHLKSEHQHKVELFMAKAGQFIPDQPKTIISDDERLARARLIMEEALELVEKGLGVEVVKSGYRDQGMTTYKLCDTYDPVSYTHLTLPTIYSV